MPNRLTMVLGAGFSQPFEIPSVAELTEIAEEAIVDKIVPSSSKSSEPVEVGSALLDIIRPLYHESNFELTLHAIESLLSYAAAESRTDPFEPQQVLRGFTQLKKQYGELADFDTLRDMRARITRALVESISSAQVQAFSHGNQSAKQELKRSTDFLNALSSHFPLSCFTLNYDTLIDRQLNWNDGFNEETPAAFKRTRFKNKLRVSEPMLCHLHGSIQYGFDATGGIVKCKNARNAIATYENERIQGVDRAGELRWTGPIISGFRKLDKINSTPFGYYYSAFTNRIITDRRLLIIGYGFKDPHLDYWLGQHKAIHGAKRRVVFIGKDVPLSHRIGTSTNWKQRRGYCRKAAGRWLWRRNNALPITWNHKRGGATWFKDEQLMVVLSGYPVDDFLTAKILEHLDPNEE